MRLLNFKKNNLDLTQARCAVGSVARSGNGITELPFMAHIQIQIQAQGSGSQISAADADAEPPVTQKHVTRVRLSFRVRHPSLRRCVVIFRACLHRFKHPTHPKQNQNQNQN